MMILKHWGLLVRRRLLTASVLGLLGLAAGAALTVRVSAAEAADMGGATVSYLKGTADKQAGSSWQALAMGQSLSQGDRVRTAAASRLELKLRDGSMLRLGESSEILLEELAVKKNAPEKKVRAKLSIGRMWAAVTSLLGSESKFEVTTSNAVAGVRGTRFEAAQDASGNTTIKVYDGRVLISNQPVYAVKGATKAKRVQVSGPAEVSRKQWEELVASAMQMVRIGAAGEMSPVESFAAADPKADDWEAWNSERDKTARLDGDK